MVKERDKWYFAHPTHSRNKMRLWQKDIELKTNIKLLNPFFDQKEPEFVFREGTEYYHSKKNKKIVSDDLKYLKKCKGIIAVINSKKTIGTHMEIMCAYILKKPIYIICTTKWISHPWLQAMATKIFSSLKEFEEFIKNHEN